MTEPILLTPGPTIVPAPVREALARPMIHHRTSDFQKILKEVGEGLKALFGTAQEVLILTSSGTGAMEAAAANLLSPGDEVIVIRGGKFGERWGELCEAYGAKVIPLDSPWGKPLHLNGLKRLLAHHPKVKAVFATLCETSTGVCFPIREIRRAMGALPALLVVDAISGLGSDPYRMDEFGADVTVCGSQKGLMLPPGLAFIALSPRAWEAVKNGKSPKYYFDLARARKAWEKTDTPFTPGINLIVGLAASLRFILEKGLDRFTEEHGRDAKWIREQALKMGLSLFTDESCASSAVTTIKVPEGLDGKDLVKRIKAKGAHFAGGQGKELEGKVIRIATMGAVGEKEVQAGMKALEETLKELGWSAKVMTR